MSDRHVLAFVLLCTAGAARAQHVQLPGLTTSGGTANATLCDLSRDGNWLAHSAGADDPGAGDTNGEGDIWLRDLVNGVRYRASVDENGAPWPTRSAGWFEPFQGMLFGGLSVSDGGERVAFVTRTGPALPPSFVYEVRVYDRTAGTSQLVSRTLAGNPANAASDAPVISGNGRHVLFLSSSPDLVAGDTNDQADLFVRDLATQVTLRIAEAPAAGGIPRPSWDLTFDGRFVAHLRAVANGAELVLVDRDSNNNGILDEPGTIVTTTLVPAPAGVYHAAPALSASGRFVAFLSRNVSGPGSLDVRRLDRDSDGNGVFDEPGGTAVLALSPVWAIPFHEDLLPFHPAISASGSRVAWIGSRAGPYHTEAAQVFTWDEVAAFPITVQTYNESSGECSRGLTGPIGPSMSGDGQRLALTSNATNLVAGDPAGYDAVLLRHDVAPAGLARYCYGNPNSVGPGARIGWSGAPSIAQNTFFVNVSGCPPGTSGLFFYGPGTTAVPFGNGVRCVSGSLYRLGAQVVGAGGDAVRHVRFDLPPASSGPGALLAGSGWNFQFHYRNPAAGGAGFNTSDGLHVPIHP